ncbi:MAG: sensor histidine kinase [Acidobacteriaceae bacterium]
MSRRRSLTIVSLGASLVGAMLILASLNAFNLHFLSPRGTGEIFVFSGLTVVIFLLLVVLLVLLVRNILKLSVDRRSRVLGARLRTRLLLGALILSLAPALFMFLFSYLLMNRSIDRWFSQPVVQLRENSTRVALELSQYAAENARAEAEALANSPAMDRIDRLNHRGNQRHSAAALATVQSHRTTLEGGFVLVYWRDQPVLQYQLPSSAAGYAIKPWLGEDDALTPQTHLALPAFLLAAARRTDQPVISLAGNDYILGSATTAAGRMVVVGLPLPTGLARTVGQIRSGARDYWTLFRQRHQIRSTYFLMLLLLTTLTLFASSWLALFLAKQMTRPVEALADAMDEIAAGHYSHRVTLGATEELSELIRSFNAMAADLEQSRTLAETSSAQLSEANHALEERRRELETILETIPSGVVTLDAQLRVLHSNRAVLDLLELHDAENMPADGSLANLPLELAFPAEIAEELRRMARRSQRMRISASEIELHGARGVLRLSASLALLDLPRNRRGYILVLEDVTEFLRAQRQTAWKEVAQRIAHEIKNPLTPISLSAERIRKHVDAPLPDSPSVIRNCSAVILSSVETMRTLVDQFGALAQFPVAHPQAVDLNTVVRAALLLFAGRLEDIQVEQRLGRDIPLVLADSEALKRALANLIDNAAEAMQGSLLRRLTVTTSQNESRSMAEIVVADTGYGITSEIRERLFLPYFSTKQRGTGLGLAIAAKIIQEHGGTIRAESNLPAGARFILELPFAETNGQIQDALLSGDALPGAPAARAESGVTR